MDTCCFECIIIEINDTSDVVLCLVKSEEGDFYAEIYKNLFEEKYLIVGQEFTWELNDKTSNFIYKKYPIITIEYLDIIKKQSKKEFEKIEKLIN